MKNVILFLSGVAVLACASCNPNNSHIAAYEPSNQAAAAFDLRSQALKYFKPLPEHAFGKQAPNEAQVELGKALYYESRLSLKGNNSCNSCHNLEHAGVDNLPTSPGDAGQNGDRNSPTTLNAALHFVQFWDGRARDVEEQAGGPILNPVEMAMPHQQLVIDRLTGIPEYKNLFSKAFPEQKQPVTYANLQQAIGAFERTLVTPSPFDAFLEGQTQSLSEEQLAGLKTFMNAGCITCHNGVALGGGMFQKFGKYHPYWEATGCSTIDKGRFDQTKDSMDLYVFKTPSLRNIAQTGPYFHDGYVSDLDKAIRIMGETQLDIKLSDEEVLHIRAFLESLSGEVPAKAKEVPAFVQQVKQGS